MDKIGLVEAIEALRAELIDAVKNSQDEDIQFPVGPVQLAFQIGVTRDANAGGKLRFWVLELGGGGGYSAETVHTLTVNLEAPVDMAGHPVKVSRFATDKP